MTQALFLKKLAKLTAKYPDRSQSEVSDPIFAAKLFDIA